MGKLNLFCWCGPFQEYAPPVILLILIVTLVFGTVGYALGMCFLLMCVIYSLDVLRGSLIFKVQIQYLFIF